MVDMSQLQKMMKQAQEVQKNMNAARDKLMEMEFVGVSGGGLVGVKLSGTGDIVAIKIKKEGYEDQDSLPDLIIAAFNDAKKKLDDATADAMSEATGGLNLPEGFNM
jgi:hypothetical protein